MIDMQEFSELRVSVIVDGKEIRCAPSINGELYHNMCQLHDPKEVKEEAIRVMLCDIRMILEKIL
jgi:hypothetical protein